MKLIDMVVTDYLNIVASDAPAPGGGSAAAFCGAQGTGLVTMVAGQTAVKKSYEADWPLCHEIIEQGKKIYDELSSDSEDYCMVGFRLKNTLTENGTVSRGVCVTDNNALESVTEYTKIRSDCSFTEDDGKTWNALSPDTVVSMNLWGFRPDVFKYIEDGFVSFLKEKLNVPKSEYYLPSVVSSLIESGTKKVNVLVAEDKWYGVTYKEDKPAVVASIGELIDKGYYDGI